MQKVKFSDLPKDEQDLVREANEASTHFHNPEGSRYVGTALSTKSGKIFKGAAVSRHPVSSNTCSERMAIDRAIYAGERDYQKLALIGKRIDGAETEAISPCGLCRQVIFEYYPNASPGSILVSNYDMSEVIITDIHELLPLSFI